MSFAGETVDRKATILAGLSLIGELQRQGLVTGGFSIEAATVYASLALIAATGAQKPSQQEAVQAALRLMKVPQEDVVLVESLLQMVYERDFVWPGL